MKRAFDLSLSLIGIILCSPLLALAALLVIASGKGPVIFTQQRAGMGFRPFNLYKFRTMVVDSQSAGPQITSGSDPRITPIGRVLRSTKLDELPQLLNVLKGDMSFVGPRPEVMKYAEMFKEEYAEVLTVRPGITDYATIKFRDEEDLLRKYQNPEDGYIKEVLPEKIVLYKKYIKEQGLMTDLKIILLTLFKVLRLS